MTNALNDMMSLDGTIVRVLPGGAFERYEGKVWAPEVFIQTDDDGQILPEHSAELVEYIGNQGWAVETGWTGQYLSKRSDPIMHTSEFIGGHLRDHILDTPGLWCALPVDVESEECPNGSETCVLSDPCVICVDGTGSDRESECAGWIVMRRDVPVTLGDNMARPGARPFVPVLRDGVETGTYIDDTSRGQVFRASHTMTADGFGYRGEPRVTLEDARKDAEEWLTENLA